MGQALELIAGQVTAPGTTLTALTMNSGNSLTVRFAAPTADIRLIQAWVDVQGAGTFRIKSPRLHDDVQGLRFDTVASEVDPLLPWGTFQKLVSQDELTVELSGSATAGDIESAALLIYYADLPGIQGNFINPQQLNQRIKHLLTIENSLSTGTSGGYSGEEAINAEFDLLKANTEYAIIGYQVDTECLAVRYRGSDFGNLGLGGPGNEASKQLTSNWFKMLSEQIGVALIPVFNSANADNVLVDCHQDENGADVTVTTICAELS